MNVVKRAVVAVLGAVSGLMLMAGSAQAALSEAAETALTTAFTAAVADATELQALVIVPIIGNVLLFVPWGFLMFISLYTIDRPTMQTYLLTFLLGLSFTLAIEAWQYFLPSRVVDVNDVIWNSAGALIGAVLGHMRLRVRFEFE